MKISSKKNYYSIALLIIDIAIFYICLLLVVKARFSINASADIFLLHIKTFTPLILLNVLLLFVNNFFEMDFKVKEDKLIILLGRIQMFVLFLGMFYFYIIPLGITPKTNLILFWLSSSLLIYIFHSYINKDIVLDKTNVLFLKQNEYTDSLKDTINENKKFGIKIIFYPKTASEEYLGEFLIQNNIKTIVYFDDDIFKKNMHHLLPKNTNFQSFEEFHEQIFKTVSLETLKINSFSESIGPNKWSGNSVVMRFFDIFLASIFLLFSLPFWPIVMFLIKLTSPGPIFYLSTRSGKNEKKIILYKFRTMTKNARTEGPAWTLPQDIRITAYGKLLRKFHIDEWPQFFNILKGDISFVGPRPEEYELAQMFKKEVPFYCLRSIVTPGLTGWAQVNMPNTHSVSDAQEKLKFDLFYVKNYSIWLNFYIIIKTLRIPFI